MENTPIPMIRLEVEHMRHAIVAAFTQHMAGMDETFRRAVDAACTPENVERTLQRATTEALNSAIDSEIRSYFSHGTGRALVKERVCAMLDEMTKK